MNKSRQKPHPSASSPVIHALARDGVHGMDFTVPCRDIDPSQFLVQGLRDEVGALNGRILYDDGKFDYVCFLEAIEHTENPYNAVRELARVLKPGGTLVFSTPNYLNIERRLKFLVTGFFTRPVSSEMFLEDCRGKTYAPGTGSRRPRGARYSKGGHADSTQRSMIRESKYI